jgi:hypothetical protein
MKPSSQQLSFDFTDLASTPGGRTTRVGGSFAPTRGPAATFPERAGSPVPEHFLQAFIDLAVERVVEGVYLSAKGICEDLREDKRFQTGDTPFKINNNLTATLARLAMEREPRLRGQFKTRERK